MKRKKSSERKPQKPLTQQEPTATECQLIVARLIAEGRMPTLKEMLNSVAAGCQAAKDEAKVKAGKGRQARRSEKPTSDEPACK